MGQNSSSPEKGVPLWVKMKVKLGKTLVLAVEKQTFIGNCKQETKWSM